MKKIVTVIFAAVLVLLCACAKEESENKTGKKVYREKEAEVFFEEAAEIKAAPDESQQPDAEKTEKEKAEFTTYEKEENKSSVLSEKVIVVDAGHGISNYNKQEAIAPNTSKTKPAFVSGTRGKNLTEEELNLAVALKLQKELEAKGAQVHMTRTTHQCDRSNIDRAKFANELNADISVKIHADGNDNSGVKGVSVLVPGSDYIKDQTVIAKSRKAGERILDEFVKSTGAENRGLSVRNDMTGFNWSAVPVVLVEMGFMTNPEEDKLMETDDYQYKMIRGIVNGLILYFEQ